MYTQEAKQKKLSPIKVTVTTVIIILAVLGLYVLFSLIDLTVSPISATGGALLIALLVGYFVLKQTYSKHLITPKFCYTLAIRMV